MSQNYLFAWVSEWKISAPKKQSESGKFGTKVGYEFDYSGKSLENRLPVCYSDGDGISAFFNVKSRVWSVKIAPKIRKESGKLSTIGCHLPSKSTNFGTLQHRTCSYFGANNLHINSSGWPKLGQSIPMAIWGVPGQIERSFHPTSQISTKSCL